ncbi:hypothetical protein NDU88_005979 [Pleurodeles waltl]|uniref:Uncharacterized protein n=1 Tax=Pleurodeles waltl TaxID=8319 RepID=A0AAV7LR35_PLEWA|nr:hypothetical protein NDU88_005979 [Pleurodeles waltl]
MKGGYTHPVQPDNSTVAAYIQVLPFARLTPSERDELDTPLTNRSSVDYLKTAKVPGGDRLPAKSYRAFPGTLADNQLTVFAEAYVRGVLPDSMRESLSALVL